MQPDQQTFSAPIRYKLLDGLRGVAALVVICYHIGEGFATSSADQIVNHGYLAVDFFFMLSGFVIGHAYDRRWRGGRLTVRNFFRRRLLRLHPMLMLGVVLGLVSFALQGFDRWDGEPVALHWTLVSALLAMFLVPAYPGAPYDVRGNGEMFPLNGPSWSLFFEYIGNIVYALLLRRLPTKVLMALAIVAGIGLFCFSIGNFSGFYHLGVGWTLGEYNFIGGMLRLCFSFTVGLLMARLYRPRHIRGAFWICTILIVGLLAMPFWGDIASGTGWINGLYDSLCVVVVFPVILYIGASGDTGRERSGDVCDMLGRLSYPVYIVHYPFMYLFYHWVWSNGLSFSEAVPGAIAAVAASIVTAWVALKYYDEPLRRRLSGR